MGILDFFSLTSRSTLPTPETALRGRDTAVRIDGTHTVLGTPTVGPWPAGYTTAVFGMGCFWGIERLFWRLPGVHSTAAGYAGGITPNPTYEQTCSGRTGHTEAVLVVFDPARITYRELLVAFWENHDPTQGMRQHNDRGTQYRSAIYATDAAQLAAAEASRDAYQARLTAAGHGTITTEIALDPPFYYAEDHHQQYLDKNPGGYCSMRGTGVSCTLDAGSGGAGLGVPAH